MKRILQCLPGTLLSALFWNLNLKDSSLPHVFKEREQLSSSAKAGGWEVALERCGKAPSVIIKHV